MTNPPEIERLVMLLKNEANAKFHAQNYREAIKLFTEAFDTATSATPLELKRILLSNRSQTYLQYASIHNALRDVDLALSSDYTTLDAPEDLTAKCRYRRAKLLCMFARYQEAQADMDNFDQLRSRLALQAPEDEHHWKSEITAGLQAAEGSERWCKDMLMRAVDLRGLILQKIDRERFPHPPAEIEAEEDESERPRVGFHTADGQINRKLDDPYRTLLEIPVWIMAPYFNLSPGKPFRTKNSDATLETDTIGSVLENLFISVAAALVDNSNGNQGQIMMSAITHDRPADSTVLFNTFGGRILEIPRSATFSQIIEGAKWPRDGPIPFRDLRRKPRARDFERDGVQLTKGSFTELYVVPNDKLDFHLQRLEDGFAMFGL